MSLLDEDWSSTLCCYEVWEVVTQAKTSEDGARVMCSDTKTCIFWSRKSTFRNCWFMFVFILVTRVQPQFPLKEGFQSRVVYMESEALGSSCIHVWMWDSCRKLSKGSRTAKVTCVMCFHFCFVELRIKPWACLVWKRSFIFWKETCPHIYIFIYA